jgi:hypothetical protein
MAALPVSVTAIAYRASNGELAWRRLDIPQALSAIAASGQAVLGGEVWVAVGEGQWHGLVPDRHGGPPGGVWHWDATPRAAGESWPAYCVRAAEESARTVAGMPVEKESDPAVRDRLFFNVTFVSEAEAAPGTLGDPK